jgi:sarcosine oxidase
MLVAVVGAGIMGLATAAALARSGHEVEVYEQYELDHTRGSSHGRSRIFRLSYPDAEWVRFAQEALSGWRDLERETGEELIVLEGLVELGETSEEALDACGVPWESLDPAELERRYGIQADERALLQPEAGFVRADRARHAFHAAAERRGARVRERARVESLDELEADVVVVTAGGWARDLLEREGISLPVTVTRETVAYFRLEQEGIPSVIDYGRGSGAAMYCVRDPQHGLKAGAHMAGVVVDPSDRGEPDATVVSAVAEWVRARFPGAETEPVAVETCLYTSTTDERFVLERHGHIVVGSACSGHGFKFAPAVGARLAGLALDGGGREP